MGKYGNVEKMVTLSMPNWRKAGEAGIAKIRVNAMRENTLESVDGHRFINMSSCSYLGLNEHPAIIKGAKDALDERGYVALSLSRARVGDIWVEETEDLLSQLFQAQAKIVTSCTSASVGILPILASGQLCNGDRPVMVFDKKAHFSMNIMKAACADETEVITIGHNDMAALELLCQTRSKVAYICDGAYSVGGSAPFAELERLQKKYGLFLYIDDSHSISCFGEKGIGMARSSLEEVNANTIILASLNKGFGSGGGVVLLGSEEQKEVLDFCGGPLCWSQTMNTATIGAIRASTRLHLAGDIQHYQDQLAERLAIIDQRFTTETTNNGLPIRKLDLKHEADAIAVSKQILEQGFYVSALFFPIVARNTAGLRVMCRANISTQDLTHFCDLVESYL